jgi:hypothetical protein
MTTVAPTFDNIAAALRSFVVSVLPTVGPDGKSLDVIIAEQNRIPSPAGSSYVVMTPLRQERLETNTDSYSDAVFTGSISGTTMTITAVDSRFPAATLAGGAVIFGPNIAAGTTVTAILSGSGQVGTYSVSPGQSVASETISAGTKQIQVSLRVAFQIDYHSADTSAGDNATIVATLLRDEFATNQFANQSPAYAVVPLYAEDPHQMPFTNDQQQVEYRWVSEALLQANITVSVPQQYADTGSLTVQSVFEEFPT